jgi:nucleotide-binding universal stress UspA family protein
MNEIRKIMVALAFSPYSEGILGYAGMLARKFDAELVVASVINKRDVKAIKHIVQLGYEVDSNDYVQSVETERRDILNALLRKQGLDEEKVKIIFKVGNPIDELLNAAVAEQVDMIVMGLKAKNEMENLLVGSVAGKIFRYSPITVVSYRDDDIARRLHQRSRF